MLRNLGVIERALRWKMVAEGRMWEAWGMNPTLSQREAVQEERRIVLLCGGLGAAKSYTGAARVVYVCAREKNQQSLVMRRSGTDLKTTTAEALAFFLARIVDPKVPEGEITYDSLKTFPRDICTFHNLPMHHITLPLSNSKVYFRHLDNAESLGSQRRGIIWIDEASEIDLPTFKQADARARLKEVTQQVFMTTNPPRVSDHWMHDIFPTQGDSTRVQAFSHPATGEDTVLYQVSTEENRENLSDAFMARFDVMTEQERQWALYGNLSAVYGVGPRMFPEFSRKRHVAEREQEPFEGTPIIRGFDVGPVAKWAACGVISVSKKGQVRFLREYEENGMGLREFFWMVRQDCAATWGNDWGYEDSGDPNAITTKSWTDGRSAKDIAAECGVYMTMGAASSTARREEIGRLLRLGGEVADLQVNPSCRMTIAGFDGGYTHEEVKGRYSHIFDAWGYGLTGQGRAQLFRRKTTGVIASPSYRFGRNEPAPVRIPKGMHTDGYGRFFR